MSTASNFRQRKWWMSRLLGLLLTLALVATACGSTTDATATTVEDDATPEVVEDDEQEESVEEVEDEPEEEPAAAEEPEAEEEPAEEEEPEEVEADLEPVSFSSLGTSVELEFDVPTDSLEGVGAAVLSREGQLDPFSSGVVILRPTGFASLDVRGNNFTLPLLTESLETWLTHPEINVSSQSQTTVGGADATVTDFVVERSDESLPDCGPPPQDSCIFFASTPDPADFALTVARVSKTNRLWEIDQGDNPAIILIAFANEGDDDWLSIVDDAVDTLVLGDPQPAPESSISLAEAGPVSFDSLGGISFDLPEDSLVFEGTQCVLLQIPTDVFESGIIIGRVDQNGQGVPFGGLQGYIDSFDGQVSREETGRTIDLFDTTLIEFAVEETGQNMSTSSCAPIDGDIGQDVQAGFVGAGTEYVAEAPGGGVYLIGWTTINPEQSDEVAVVFDQIVESLEVTDG